MKEFLSKGMQNADQVLHLACLYCHSDLILLVIICIIVLQALLSGCSAGGLASIIHCDEFRDLFPKTTKVKCLSDAGLFLDA